MPEIDASVRTRVVSWNDAAEMNESVESDAFVIPSSSGRPVAGRPPLAITRSFSSMNRKRSDLLLDQELGVANLLDLHPPHHLPDDDLDVLVVDVDALEPVDLLDLVDEITRAAPSRPRPNRMSCGLLGPSISGSPARTRSPSWTFTCTPRGSEYSLGLPPASSGTMRIFRCPLTTPPCRTETVDLRDDGRLARLARLEELDDARQTARDVLRLGRLARNLREHLPRETVLVVLDHEVGV